jgi:hypothetical protein
MPNTTFTCHDLEPAAFLWVRGLRFVGVEPMPHPRSPNHVVFKFHDPEGLAEQQLSAYQLGAEVAALHYALALKRLKDQIFTRSRT